MTERSLLSRLKDPNRREPSGPRAPKIQEESNLLIPLKDQLLPRPLDPPSHRTLEVFNPTQETQPSILPHNSSAQEGAPLLGLHSVASNLKSPRKTKLPLLHRLSDPPISLLSRILTTCPTSMNQTTQSVKKLGKRSRELWESSNQDCDPKSERFQQSPYSLDLNRTSQKKIKTQSSQYTSMKSLRPKLRTNRARRNPPPRNPSTENPRGGNTHPPVTLNHQAVPTLIQRLDLASDIKNPEGNPESSNQKCHGSILPTRTLASRVKPRPLPYSPFTTETSRRVDSLSPPLLMPQTTSPSVSGNEFSQENPSTSTKSSLHSIGLQLLRRGRFALETHLSLLARLKLHEKFPQHQTGLPPGERLLKQLPSSSHTELRNSQNTETSSTANLRLGSPLPIDGLSPLTSRSEAWYEEDRRLYSPTTKSSIDLSPQFSHPKEFNTPRIPQRELRPPGGKSVIVSTSGNVAPLSANTDMPVKSAIKPATESPPVSLPTELKNLDAALST